jgi:flavin-binding protein dodecin
MPIGGAASQDRPPSVMTRLTQEVSMGTVARITQISARSEQGFDDAVRVGIDRANSTLRNVTGAWVKDQKVEVTNGQITAFQVILEITFILD